MNRRSKLTALCLGLLLVFAFSCADDTSDSRSWDDTLSWVRSDFPEVRYISTQDLAAWQGDADREAPLLLDTRTAEEYKVSHLRGAVLADSDAAVTEALRGLGLDRSIVVYCSVGYRSSEAAQDLQQMGYLNVYNLEGSIFAWANEGRPVVRGGEAVSEVHPFDDDWGVLLERRYHPRP